MDAFDVAQLRRELYCQDEVNNIPIYCFEEAARFADHLEYKIETMADYGGQITREDLSYQANNKEVMAAVDVFLFIISSDYNEPDPYAEVKSIADRHGPVPNQE